jgi:hypothetical protein
MSNIVEPQIVETKSSFIDVTKLEGWTGGINPNNMYSQKPIVKPTNPIEGGQAFLDAQLQLAQQQALMEQMTTYSGLTDKFFGKTEGYGIERTMKLGAYIILGAVVGRYVAKNIKKSTTLGMVLGGLAPLLAFKLTIEYDKKNMPKQEPRQKVAIEPKPTLTTKPKLTPSPYMPQVIPMTMAEEREMAIRFYKTLPDEFVFNNVRYFKNSNLEFYKQPFSSEGFSGVMPIKISGAEFSNTYIKFRDKDLPKSPFDKFLITELLRTDNITIK